MCMPGLQAGACDLTSCLRGDLHLYRIESAGIILPFSFYPLIVLTRPRPPAGGPRWAAGPLGLAAAPGAACSAGALPWQQRPLAAVQWRQRISGAVCGGWAVAGKQRCSHSSADCERRVASSSGSTGAVPWCGAGPSGRRSASSAHATGQRAQHPEQQRSRCCRPSPAASGSGGG